MQGNGQERRDEYKALTRAAVIDAAAEQFIERGFVQTTIDDVAAAARVSKAPFITTSPTRPTYSNGVQRSSGTADRSRRPCRRPATRQPWTRLQVGVAAYLDQTIENAEHRALLQVARLH